VRGSPDTATQQVTGALAVLSVFSFVTDRGRAVVGAGVRGAGLEEPPRAVAGDQVNLKTAVQGRRTA